MSTRYPEGEVLLHRTLSHPAPTVPFRTSLFLERAPIANLSLSHIAASLDRSSLKESFMGNVKGTEENSPMHGVQGVGFIMVPPLMVSHVNWDGCVKCREDMVHTCKMNTA